MPNSAKQRSRTNSKESRRSITREYSIGGKRACKVMYISTVGVTNQCLTTASKNNVGRKSINSTVNLSGGSLKGTNQRTYKPFPSERSSLLPKRFKQEISA